MQLREPRGLEWRFPWTAVVRHLCHYKLHQSSLDHENTLACWQSFPSAFHWPSRAITGPLIYVRLQQRVYPRSIATRVRMHNSASDEVEWKCFISECIFISVGLSSESVFIYQVAELNMCGGNRCGKKLMPPVCFHNVSTDFKSFTQRKDALQWILDHILEEDREPLLIFPLSLSRL